MNASLSESNTDYNQCKKWLINKLDEMFIKMFMKKYISISSLFLRCKYFINGYLKCTEIKLST